MFIQLASLGAVFVKAGESTGCFRFRKEMVLEFVEVLHLEMLASVFHAVV